MGLVNLALFVRRGGEVSWGEMGRRPIAQLPDATHAAAREFGAQDRLNRNFKYPYIC